MKAERFRVHERKCVHKLFSDPEKLVQGDSLWDLKNAGKSGMLPIKDLMELIASEMDN